MKIICGVDIGNSTTEVTIARIDESTKDICYISENSVKTTGVKGTLENISGIRLSIMGALKKGNLTLDNLDLIKINEAAPVIGESAMETITETLITDSAMIGHNPDTPSGIGLAKGITKLLEDIKVGDKECHIAIVNKNIGYEEAAKIINSLGYKGVKIVGAILKEDEAVLLNNRLINKISIVDEVKNIEKVPLGCLAAIEVAEIGSTLKVLSNPFGIASIFKLSADETKKITPIAKGLIGLKSGVIIKTPKGEVKEKKIKVGSLKFVGDKVISEVDINLGADFIMKKASEIESICDVIGEKSSNVGFMINGIKDSMAKLSNINIDKVKIKDILAIDTVVPLKIKGAIADETYKEKAVAIAAMVKTEKLPLNEIKKDLEKQLNVSVEVNGIEGVMASIGALTTRGTKLPIAVVDMGGGSTDVALLNENGQVKTIHLAGAGELVTMLINLELGLDDRNIAEEIKKNIVGKVENLYTLRLENGDVKFFEEQLDSKLYGRVVVVKGKELIPILKDLNIADIVSVRRKIKEEVFVRNIIRGMKKISPMNNINLIPNVVLVGGSAMDFEIPDMILKKLSSYGITAGSANIRNSQGPRHAVSTGLVLNYIERL